jgi:hypothetical protein
MTSTRGSIVGVQIGRVNARLSFQITPEDDSDPGERTHVSGRLDLLLADLFDRWELAEIDDVRIHVGDVIIPGDVVAEVFEAMKRVRDGG